MANSLSERDLILLNSYLDGELPAAERSTFEQRLARESVLSAELQALRATKALLGMAERVRVPRNFTLDPALYSKPARTNLLDRLSMGSLRPLAAGASLVLAAALCVGAVLIYSGGSLGSAAAEAPADVAYEMQEVPAEEAAQAEELAAPMAEEPALAAPAPAEEAAEEEPAPEMGAAAIPEATADEGGANAAEAAPSPLPTQAADLLAPEAEQRTLESTTAPPEEAVGAGGEAQAPTLAAEIEAVPEEFPAAKEDQQQPGFSVRTAAGIGLVIIALVFALVGLLILFRRPTR